LTSQFAGTPHYSYGEVVGEGCSRVQGMQKGRNVGGKQEGERRKLSSEESPILSRGGACHCQKSAGIFVLLEGGYGGGGEGTCVREKGKHGG